MKQVKSKLLRHKVDLYQKMTCMMKRVNFKIITSQHRPVSKNDLYHETGELQNHYVIKLTSIKKRPVS